MRRLTSCPRCRRTQARLRGACPTWCKEEMMKTKIAAALALAMGMALVAPSAHADPPKKDSNYEYKFTDDNLLGKDMAGNVPIITTTKPMRRDRLLRPRVQFVQEMLKSVENM